MHTILALAAGLLTARAPVDTTITVRGILQLQLDSAGRPARAIIVVPAPFLLDGHSVNALIIQGDAGRWRRYDSHYVQATGAVGAPGPDGVPFYPERCARWSPRERSARRCRSAFRSGHCCRWPYCRHASRGRWRAVPAESRRSPCSVSATT